MSKEYKNTDPLSLAARAERDLGSEAAVKGHDAGTSYRHGRGAADSTTESGIDTTSSKKFPGGDATYGSAASDVGDNREIPESEGGGVDRVTGRPMKARDFEGEGGLEDKRRMVGEQRGGDDEVNVKGNVRR